MQLCPSKTTLLDTCLFAPETGLSFGGVNPLLLRKLALQPQKTDTVDASANLTRVQAPVGRQPLCSEQEETSAGQQPPKSREDVDLPFTPTRPKLPTAKGPAPFLRPREFPRCHSVVQAWLRAKSSVLAPGASAEPGFPNKI